MKKVLVIDDNFPDLPKEIADKVQKMDSVSVEEVKKMMHDHYSYKYDNNHRTKKIRKCSNKKYVKRKKAKNGRK